MKSPSSKILHWSGVGGCVKAPQEFSELQTKCHKNYVNWNF